MRRGDAEERAAGGVSGAASVEAEAELVKAGLEMFAPRAVMEAERPALEIGRRGGSRAARYGRPCRRRREDRI